MQIAISQTIKNEVKDYFYITLGLLIYTFGWTIFLLPYQIVTGGVTGIAAVIFCDTLQQLLHRLCADEELLLVVCMNDCYLH